MQEKNKGINIVLFSKSFLIQYVDPEKYLRPVLL